MGSFACSSWGVLYPRRCRRKCGRTLAKRPKASTGGGIETADTAAVSAGLGAEKVLELVLLLPLTDDVGQCDESAPFAAADSSMVGGCLCR